MDNERPRREINWGSVISFLIFLLLFAGRPLLNLINQLLGGNTLAIAGLLPMIIGGLVIISILVAVVRAVGARSSGDTRLPTGPTTASRPPGRAGAPLPPFGGSPIGPRSLGMPPRSTTQLPPPPRYDPLINPAVLVVGIVGVVLIGGLALLIIGQNFP